MIFLKNVFDIPETVPASLNFAARHMFSFYPKKLNCSSRNTYIKTIRLPELGKPTCLLKILKNVSKLTSFF